MIYPINTILTMRRLSQAAFINEIIGDKDMLSFYSNCSPKCAHKGFNKNACRWDVKVTEENQECFQPYYLRCKFDNFTQFEVSHDCF